MLKEYLSEIANAIRTKHHVTEKMNARDFATLILDIPSVSGPEFLDKESYFWDVYQDNGTRTNYNGAFAGTRWDETTFVPKYDIRPTDASNMFYGARKIKDLTTLIKNAGIVFDTSQCTSFLGMFTSADYISHIPTISTVSCTTISTLFYWNGALITIEKIILKDDGSQKLTNFLVGLGSLQNVMIEGKIGDTVNISTSKNLTTKSIVSIIEALYEGSSGKTLTLSQTAVNKMSFPVTSEQSGNTYNSWDELEGSKNNWTISLV